MKNTFSLLVFMLSVLTVVHAQERYRDQVIDSVTVDTYTYAEKDNQVLDLDLYQPAYDGAYDRPVLMYVHGGSFSSGERNEPYIQEFCKRVAEYGYVVASISYRLTRKGTETGFSYNFV